MEGLEEKEYKVEFDSIYVFAVDEEEARLKAHLLVESGNLRVDVVESC